jgi:hypothetical protein
MSQGRTAVVASSPLPLTPGQSVYPALTAPIEMRKSLIPIFLLLKEVNSPSMKRLPHDCR